MPLVSLHNFSYQITLKNVNMIFVKYENLTTLSIQVYCIPYYIHHYPHTLWNKAQCRKTKWKWKIGQYFKDDAVRCQSISTY